MKKFLFLLALGMTASLGAAPEIVSHRAENFRAVRALDQELAALFTFPRKSAPIRKLRITFDRDAPKPIARIESGNAIELVVRDDGGWMYHDDVMMRLVGTLLAHRAGSEKELRAPRFLVAALRGELRGVANSQRINRSNSWFIFLRALLAAERPIDYSVSAFDGAFLPVKVYQEEAAQVLLYAARRRDLTGAVLRDFLDGKAVLERLLLSLDEAARREGFSDADALLRHTAGFLAWHRFAPRTAEASRREFARLAQRNVEELDLFGNPTGRHVPVALEVWCNMLGTRPDAKSMRQAFLRDLRGFARGEPPESRAVVARLAALDLCPGDAEKITALKQELAAVWSEREKVDRFLAESEAKAGGIGVHVPCRIDTIRHRSELLSPRGKAFLDRVEKLYLGE